MSDYRGGEPIRQKSGAGKTIVIVLVVIAAIGAASGSAGTGAVGEGGLVVSSAVGASAGVATVCFGHRLVIHDVGHRIDVGSSNGICAGAVDQQHNAFSYLREHSVVCA